MSNPIVDQVPVPKDLNAIFRPRSVADIHSDERCQIANNALERLGPSGGWLELEEIQILLTATGLPMPQKTLAECSFRNSSPVVTRR